MSRKIIIYGFAFASLICLSTFIYFENKLYMDPFTDFLIGRTTPVFVIIVGILLLILSFKKSLGGVISYGRAGFSGMLFTGVICIIWPVFFFAYTQKQPQHLEAMKENTLKATREYYFKNRATNKELTLDVYLKTMKGKRKMHTQKMQINATLFTYFSAGLLASCGLALLLGKESQTIIAHKESTKPERQDA